MDFFAAQDDARARTRRLVMLYFLALAALVLVTHVAGVAILSSTYSDNHRVPYFWRNLFRLDLFLGFSTLVVATIFFGTITKIFALRQGGAAVAKDLGGREISRNSNDALEARLLNIVEEMAIASGMPVPRVFLLNNEGGINAFAAGYRLEDAAIGVTRGAIEHLSRDQLQGVIAHEFSHILNADMRLNIRLIGILNGVLCIFLMGKMILRVMSEVSSDRGRSRRSSDKNSPATFIFLIGFALILIGSLGALFARMIQAAVSRQREFLADSSAVQFTRNPQGIAGALAVIGGLKEGSQIHHFRASEAEHMLFGSGTGGFLAGMFATHPPLEERIQRLTGRAPEFVSASTETRTTAQSDMPGQVASLADPVVSTIGTISSSQISQAQNILQNFPEAIVSATRDLQGAQSILVALMLDRNAELREKQLPCLTSPESPLAASEIFKLLPLTDSLAANHRLALLDIAIPTLRKLTPRQYTPFNTLLKALADADQQITLPEYLLLTILRRSVEPHVFSTEPSRYLISNRSDLAAPFAIILSAIAQVSTTTSGAPAEYFNRVVSEMSSWRNLMEYSDQPLTFADLDENLDLLAKASPFLKREIIQGCNRMIMADHSASPEELELFRAVGAALGCPVPLIALE